MPLSVLRSLRPGGAPPSGAAGASAGTEPPLAMLRRLEWRVKHAVENVLSGEYRSAFRGRGMEFDQVVKYEFGDDIRDIDWNVTARLGEPYRKKYVEEREVTLLLLFEDSPSLQFGSGSRTKREALLELAGLVALLCAINRDRLAVVHATPSGHVFHPPVRGRGAILHTAAALLGRPPPPLLAPESSAAPAVPWKLVAHAAPRHSIFLWLGDFPPRLPPDGWRVLQRRYRPLGFRVDDPWERQLPHAGEIAAFDPAAGRLVRLDTSSPLHQNAHTEWKRTRAAAWEELFPDPLARLSVDANEPMLAALLRFFHARMSR